MEEADGISGHGSGAADDDSDDEQLVRLQEGRKTAAVISMNEATNDSTKKSGRKHSTSSAV